MALIDYYAAEKIRELREERGLSPEALALEIKIHAQSQPWGARGTVDAHTIRRVERGHVPGPRVQFVLSQFFGVPMRELWRPGRQRTPEGVAA